MRKRITRPGDQDISSLYEELVRTVKTGDSRPWSRSPVNAQQAFNEGAKAALGWVLGQEDRPIVEGA